MKYNNKIYQVYKMALFLLQNNLKHYDTPLAEKVLMKIRLTGIPEEDLVEGLNVSKNLEKN
jgi:hypothetical protein